MLPTGNDEFDLSEAVAILERTPPALRALLAGLPEAWVRATEGDGTWSPRNVVGHLINGERTNWIPRARHVLAGNTGPFPPFDRTAQFAENAGKNLDALLGAFADARRESLVALREMNLTAAELRRTALHPDFGTVTLAQLLATWVAHDLDHLAQIARVMAKRYREAVGPWSAYLSILRDRE